MLFRILRRYTFAVSANKGQWELYIDFDIFVPALKKSGLGLALVSMGALLCGPTFAQSPSSTQMEGAHISLLAAPSMAGALLADSITLAQDERLAFVSIDLDDGWKTYWRLPGRFGLAPVLDWSMSQNIAAVETVFPMPSLFDEGDGSSIGYSGQVLWPVRVQPDDPKEPIIVSLSMDLGLCEALCFPVSVDLSQRLSTLSGEAASMADILDLAGSLSVDEARVPPEVFYQDEDDLILDWGQGISADSFAVAENEEGKHSLLRLDDSGAFRGPWRHEQAPTHVTVISPEAGMHVIRLGN